MSSTHAYKTSFYVEKLTKSPIYGDSSSKPPLYPAKTDFNRIQDGRRIQETREEFKTAN